MKADGAGECSVDTALAMVAGRWKPMLLWYLLSGTKRYGELRRAIDGISERMLARQLDHLERDGLVTRAVYPEVPPRVEYTLTDDGRSLAVILEQLAHWLEQRTASPVHVERNR